MKDRDSFWATLDPAYRLILCDVWGVIHDGVRPYPGAARRLTHWRGEGRCVALLTNAPRPAAFIQAQLQQIGLPRSAYDFVASSGEVGIAALKALGEPVGFLGTEGDREILATSGLRIAVGQDFSDLACIGLEEGRSNPNDYRSQLERWAKRGVRMHCLNPDRTVVYGGAQVACAGAIADIYEAIGGEVTWYGKPYEPIYRHALQIAGNPTPEQVLAVGDAIQTDAAGAAQMGFDFVFVAGGIHAEQGFPAAFAAEQGLGGWRPLAVVDGLA
jgi:HAD superfamily hydrolase (TIGR01459 family)